MRHAGKITIWILGILVAAVVLAMAWQHLR